MSANGSSRAEAAPSSRPGRTLRASRVWVETSRHYHSWNYDPDTGARIEPAGWNCTATTDQAIALLRRHEPETPCFLVVSWHPPHAPFNPPEADQAPYPPDTLVTRPNVRPSLEGRDIRRGTARALTADAALREAMRGYYGGITVVDRECARLLETVAALGQGRDTIVVNTSDHGEMLGSQGRMAKEVPFEDSCRVPLFVRYPGVTPQGGASDTLSLAARNVTTSTSRYAAAAGSTARTAVTPCRQRASSTSTTSRGAVSVKLPSGRPAASVTAVSPADTFRRPIIITSTQSTPSRCGPSGVGCPAAVPDASIRNWCASASQPSDDTASETIPSNVANA